ncbi:hypothetical protein GEMRC1_012740 [Eukaryota sp. GEM-RC1]
MSQPPPLKRSTSEESEPRPVTVPHAFHKQLYAWVQEEESMTIFVALVRAQSSGLLTPDDVNDLPQLSIQSKFSIDNGQLIAFDGSTAVQIVPSSSSSSSPPPPSSSPSSSSSPSNRVADKLSVSDQNFRKHVQRFPLSANHTGIADSIYNLLTTGGPDTASWCVVLSIIQRSGVGKTHSAKSLVDNYSENVQCVCFMVTSAIGDTRLKAETGIEFEHYETNGYPDFTSFDSNHNSFINRIANTISSTLANNTLFVSELNTNTKNVVLQPLVDKKYLVVYIDEGLSFKSQQMFAAFRQCVILALLRLESLFEPPLVCVITDTNSSGLLTIPQSIFTGTKPSISTSGITRLSLAPLVLLDPSDLKKDINSEELQHRFRGFPLWAGQFQFYKKQEEHRLQRIKGIDCSDDVSVKNQALEQLKDFILTKLDRTQTSFDQDTLLNLNVTSVFLQSICLIALGEAFGYLDAIHHPDLLKGGVAILLPPSGVSPFAPFNSDEFSKCLLAPPLNENCLFEALPIIAKKFVTHDKYLEFVSLVCKSLIALIAPTNAPLIESSKGFLLELLVALALVLCSVWYDSGALASQVFTDLGTVFEGTLKLAAVKPKKLNHLDTSKSHLFNTSKLKPLVSCRLSGKPVRKLKNVTENDKIVFCGASVPGPGLYIPAWVTQDGDFGKECDQIWIPLEVKLRQDKPSKNEIKKKFKNFNMQKCLFFQMGPQNAEFSYDRLNVLNCRFFSMSLVQKTLLLVYKD